MDARSPSPADAFRTLLDFFPAFVAGHFDMDAAELGSTEKALKGPAGATGQVLEIPMRNVRVARHELVDPKSAHKFEFAARIGFHGTSAANIFRIACAGGLFRGNTQDRRAKDGKEGCFSASEEQTVLDWYALDTLIMPFGIAAHTVFRVRTRLSKRLPMGGHQYISPEVGIELLALRLHIVQPQPRVERVVLYPWEGQLLTSVIVEVTVWMTRCDIDEVIDDGISGHDVYKRHGRYFDEDYQLYRDPPAKWKQEVIRKYTEATAILPRVGPPGN
jgi:hypothetical protein